MKLMKYEIYKALSCIYITRKSDEILVAKYYTDNKVLKSYGTHYYIDELEEIMEFVKSYEMLNERQKALEEELNELFGEDEENE